MSLRFMELAIEQAKKSGRDIPVGAVLVLDGEVIATAHNEKEKNQDPTLHAEMIVIKKASSILENWRLSRCELYVTLEPCPMCAWAIIQSRIQRVYFVSYDSLYGALISKMDLRKASNSSLEVFGGIMEQECDNILNEFFRDLR